MATTVQVQQPLAAPLPFPCLPHDLEAFLADIGFGYHYTPSPEDEDMAAIVTTPEEEDRPVTSAGSGDVVSGGASLHEEEDEGRRRIRRISNRESARRSRARKQRYLEEQRATVAALRAGNRDLAARLRGARARAGLVALANARVRAEADALGRRLALALRQLYAGGSVDVQTHLASLIA